MSAPFPGLPAGFPAGPKTPEPTNNFPTAGDDARPPSPPRPRLRLKRRAVPHLSAPTQNFLASVAAADVPIPSIEVPEQDSSFPGTLHFRERQEASQSLHLSTNVDGNFLSVRGRSTFSPPKTPAPGALPSTSPSRYPNWSIDSVFSSSAESSPDPECASSSRPSTARSTQTSSSSLFSRFSQLSDDEHCASPEEDGVGKFKFDLGGPLDELRRNPGSSGHDHNTVASQRPLRKAPWTKAMSSHLWATYILYLQDPKVTPFRVGKSCVPPHGVCLRVAREAKRSWKGAKAMAKASASSTEPAAASLSVPSDPTATVSDDVVDKSGSSTPTAPDSSSGSTFMEWPHTNAATRAHLRELCRLKAATPGGGARGLQYMSRSPTPFTQAAATRYRTLRATPGLSSSSTFATQEMVLSLSLSTSETMQPHGPLAQLTRSASDLNQGLNIASAFDQDAMSPVTAIDRETSMTGAQAFSGRLTSAIEAEEPSFAERRRLGSPFSARSYGPSSSSSLAAVLGLSTSNSRQPHTIGPRRTLQSPVRLSRSGTQKRHTKHLSQDLRRRPGLASDFFTEPSSSSTAELAAAGTQNAEFSSTSVTRHDELFIPRTEPVPTLTSSSSAPELGASSAVASSNVDIPVLSDHLQPPPSAFMGNLGGPTSFGLTGAASLQQSLQPPPQPPARLGSPFSSLSASSTSFSFPNRFSQPNDFDLASLGRPFATVQRIVQPKAVPTRSNLASRLAYIDQRLRELNNRSDSRPRRSDSPL